MNSSRAQLFFAQLLALLLIPLQLAAQVDEDKSADEATEVLEEIVVYGSREGDPTDADPKYEEIWRQRMLDQVARMRLEEETKWREDLTWQSSEDSRIVLGYDPAGDRLRRQDLDLVDMPGDTVKPATLFRAKF